MKWNAKQIDVTFDADGGTPAVQSKVQTFGTNYVINSVGQPSNTGYTFAGWWTDRGSAGDPVTAETPVTNPNDHTIYAH